MPEWLPIVIGMLAMYLPTLYGLCTDTWANEEQAHGPIILALSVWLLYREWPEMMRRSETAAPSAWGWPLLVVGALLYILGRSQHVVLADAGSVVWVLSAILLLKRGVAGWRALGFALFFMLFMIPLPETLVTAVTISCSGSATRSPAAASCCRSAPTSCWWPTPAPACTPC
jgi:exosortase